ncbi:MAG: beta-propeller domain-containing protein, partial [Gammaproteobacteria bacterium]|nr:beta-propeller domain-containing protein [Gammaproteobacteria bacterium]
TGQAPLVSVDTGSGQQYSQTNLIQRDVDESDLLKTDGKYLYIGVNPVYDYAYMSLSEQEGVKSATDLSAEVALSTVRIMSVDDSPTATEVSKISLPVSVHEIRGIYISQYDENSRASQILVIAQSYSDQIDRSGTYGFYNSVDSVVYAYDVSSPDVPVLSWNIEIQGSYVASRRLNDRLYFISNKYVQLTGFDPWDASRSGRSRNTRVVNNVSAEDVLPETFLNGSDAGFVKADDCLVPVEQSYSAAYGVGVMSILAIPYAEPEHTHASCTLESSHEIYVSNKAIYFSIGDYYKEKDTTLIHKIAFTETGLDYKASARVNGFTGWRNAQFRMSEHNDKLRVLTTEYDTNFLPVHKIHILEEDEVSRELKLISQLPNEIETIPIGKPGEDVYGVRFYGDYAYAVTYRRIDPLYVINLKDPEAPFVEGALELPGFSEYLHPIGDDLLLGIGRDVEEFDGGVGIQGIKIGLFDVSEKNNPVLLDELVIGSGGTYSPVLSDYKALTFLPGELEGDYRFAFPLLVYGDASGSSPRGYGSWLYSGLGMFEINRGDSITLVRKDVLKTSTSQNNDYDYTRISEARSVIINDNVHYVLDGKVWSASWGEVENVAEAQ